MFANLLNTFILLYSLFSVIDFTTDYAIPYKKVSGYARYSAMQRDTIDFSNAERYIYLDNSNDLRRGSAYKFYYNYNELVERIYNGDPDSLILRIYNYGKSWRKPTLVTVIGAYTNNTADTVALLSTVEDGSYNDFILTGKQFDALYVIVTVGPSSIAELSFKLMLYSDLHVNYEYQEP